MLKKIVLCLSLVLVLCACSPTESPADVEAAVKAAFQEYGASVVDDDMDRWIALWTEDGVRMPPGLPVTEGREAIYAQVSGNIGLVNWSEFEIDVAEVQVAGDWAYARGTYTVNGTLIESGDPILIDGKFMSIFQRQSDGSWKLHRDIFNSNE